MRRRIMGRAALMAVAATFGLAAAADAGERSWYLSLEGGVEFEGGAPANYDSGWAGLATIGTGITSHLSLEAEFGYRTTTGAGTWSAVDIDQTTLMLNAVYETPISKEVSFEIGLGAGGAHVSLGRDNQIAAQLKLGLSVDLTDDIELVANYRYVEVFRTFVDDSTVSVGIRFAL